MLMVECMRKGKGNEKEGSMYISALLMSILLLYCELYIDQYIRYTYV